MRHIQGIYPSVYADNTELCWSTNNGSEDSWGQVLAIELSVGDMVWLEIQDAIYHTLSRGITVTRKTEVIVKGGFKNAQMFMWK